MWTLKENNFDPEKVVPLGNKFLTGNGYLGYRGTLDEYTSSDCVGLNIAGAYDGVAGKWRETVNAFNPFYLVAECDGRELTVRGGNVLSHAISLDISCGVFTRTTVFDTPYGKVELRSERFVSMAQKNVLCSRTVIRGEKPFALKIKAGVDGSVWDLNGPHLTGVCYNCDGGVITVRARTQEKGTPVAVHCKYSLPLTNFSGGFAQIEAQVDGEFVLERVAGVYFGEEAPLPQGDYAQHYAANKAAWQQLWKYADVKLDGDESAQFALRYSIYHLLILAPKGDYSIAARGLSGQTYKGAVFWDTEIFMLPFYLTVLPDVAKRLVRYRIDTLDEARKKAAYYGYDGAFYAWESQDGYDACSDFNVVDVFTHRPVRTYFKDKQIHISADVAYAVCQYYSRTGDDSLMLSGGLETLLECARFFRSYSYFNHNKNRYELLDVIGPDEYHERVNNNAYTNYMAHYAATNAIKLTEELQKKYPEEAGKILSKLPEGVLSALKEWSDKLYLPKPNGEGIIEQFDGYFRLEDVSVDEVRFRLASPNEYWGCSGGVATATRVIKQADVIMLFNLLPDLFPIDVQRANCQYYLQYTEHGSSLSHCAYALTSCRVGLNGGAYAAFMNSAQIDLLGGGKQWAGEIYIGGTHPAANGGAWITAVCGFAGLSYVGGKLRVKPNLPQNISQITFTATEGGQRYAVTVTNKNTVKEQIL